MSKQTIRFTLPGQIPSGKNHVGITRYGRRYPLERFVRWRRQMSAEVWKLRANGVLPNETIRESLVACVHYHAGDLIRRDAPGMIDALFHLLEHTAIIADDYQIQTVCWIFVGLDRENPKVEIELIFSDGGGSHGNGGCAHRNPQVDEGLHK